MAEEPAEDRPTRHGAARGDPAEALGADVRPAAALVVGELDRAQLADLIHDDVLQVLGAGLLAAETCEQAWELGRGDLLPEQLAALRELLEQAVGRLRNLMAELRPYQEGAAGLEAALQRAFERFQRRNHGTVRFQQVAEAPLDPTDALLAYRLTLEALWTLADLDRPAAVQLELRVASAWLALEASFRPLADGQEGDLLAAKRVTLLRWRAQALGGTLDRETPRPGEARLRLRAPLPR